MMQTITISKTALFSAQATRKPTGRASMVVRAEQNSRRAALFSGVASVVGLSAGASLALSSVDLFDDRKAVAQGFEIIYEARDLDLPQSVRDGMTQMKQSLDATKTRVAESQKRFQTEIAQNINKKYWTNAQNALRNQVGTLRFDLNTLAAAKDSKASRVAANQTAKQFFAEVESLDIALREKNLAKAQSAYDKVVKSLDKVLA
eukprot:TRINITY_DN70_c0_g1_i3.p3 TRINITY_DN70_c0_g1~~TRINITY_DN70_c0_g1_i3.p3  ORF type:complete len:204 (-),score=49.75 TRINITY_DN70_c0_g1_i3:156-767(-)